MFGNGAAYCTLTDPTVVIFLALAVGQPCVHSIRKGRQGIRIYQHMLAPGPQCNLMTCYYLVTSTVESDPWGPFNFRKTELYTDVMHYYMYQPPKLPFRRHWHTIYILYWHNSVQVEKLLIGEHLPAFVIKCVSLNWEMLQWSHIYLLYGCLNGSLLGQCLGFCISESQVDHVLPFAIYLHDVVYWSLRACIFTGCLHHKAAQELLPH